MVPLIAFDPLKVLQAVEQERCTALHGVPTMFIAELNHPDFRKFDLSSLRTGIMAGSNCPIEVMRRVVDEMGAKEITIAYGQTESSPVITQTRTDDPIELRVSTVGRVLPNVEAKIVDPATGREVPPGVQGELCTRGYHVMKGYYKMPEATAEAIDDEGWLHTGDLAVMDENGYFRITGRLKDMIIRGGKTFTPGRSRNFSTRIRRSWMCRSSAFPTRNTGSRWPPSSGSRRGSSSPRRGARLLRGEDRPVQDSPPCLLCR